MVGMTSIVATSQSKPLRLRRLVVAATAGAFLDGYSIVIMIAALLLLVPRFHLTSVTEGILTASIFGGAVIGALISGPLTDRVGRRTIFMLDIAAFFVLSVLQAVAQNVPELLVLRALVGVAIGFDMPAGTALLAEVSPRKSRGAITSAMNTVWVSAFVVAGLVGYLLYQVGGLEAWRWMFLSAAIPAIILFFLRKDVPESPSWLRAAGRYEEADAIDQRLTFLDPKDRVSYQGSAQRRGSLFDILKVKEYRRAVAFFTIYWGLQAFAGGNTLFYTGVVFHEVINFSGANSLLFAVALDFLYVLGLVAVTYWVIDKVGRKPLAVWTCGFASLGALVTAFTEHSVVILVIAYSVMSVSVQLSTQPFWPWSVESLPTRVRGTGQAIGSAGGKLGLFIGLFLWPIFFSHVNWVDAYLVGCGLFVLLIIFVLVAGHETKDNDLDAIEQAANGMSL